MPITCELLHKTFTWENSCKTWKMNKCLNEWVDLILNTGKKKWQMIWVFSGEKFYVPHLNENIENCLLKGEGTGKPSHFYIKNKQTKTLSFRQSWMVSTLPQWPTANSQFTVPGVGFLRLTSIMGRMEHLHMTRPSAV